jgi:hypothetical protein
MSRCRREADRKALEEYPKGPRDMFSQAFGNAVNQCVQQ